MYEWIWYNKCVFNGLYAFSMIFVDIWLIRGLKYLLDKFTHMHMFLWLEQVCWFLNILMNLFLCLLNGNSLVWYLKGVYVTIYCINGVWIFQILKCLVLLYMCIFILSIWIFQTCWKWSKCIKIIQNHFCIFGVKMSIVFLWKNLVNFALKLF